MAEPAWKAELREQISAVVCIPGNYCDEYGLTDATLAAVLPHIEAAYKRGHDAGRSRTGYRLTAENERLRRELAATQKAKAENDERFQLAAAKAEAKLRRVREAIETLRQVMEED